MSNAFKYCIVLNSNQAQKHKSSSKELLTKATVGTNRNVNWLKPTLLEDEIDKYTGNIVRHIVSIHGANM